MHTVIETYRGFEILFDTESERFTYLLDHTSWQQKQSYATCKKSIDDYLKANAKFEPFAVRHVYTGKTVIIASIRKDGRCVTDLKEQISSYEEDRYVEYREEDNIIYKNIENINKEIRVLEDKIKEEYKKVSSLSLTTMKSKFSNLFE